MPRSRLWYIFILLTILTACSGSGERKLVTQTDLLEGFTVKSPLDEAALTMPTDAAPPKHVFEGRLELIGEAENGGINHLRGGTGTSPHLPEFDFEFIQTEGYLVPLQRGLIITEHDQWNYFLEPGKVWYEPGDGAYSRASFPVALSWKGSNALHNGTMTFIFNNDGISKVWYQFTKEITFSYRADLWGLLEAVYHPEQIAGSDQTKADFTKELTDRYPTKPMEALAQDYPQLDPEAFGRDVTLEALNWYGFVVGGVNYLGGCQTRYGTYPYCESMRAPSYSTAKSAFASLALMRLAQKYDPDITDALIKDYVPEAADSIGDWSMVTFDHVIDMATGNYKSAAHMVDEEHWDSDPFWLEDAYDSRIAAAFNWPHTEPPGRTWVYRTFDTFIITRAMQNYLVTKDGQDADIFELLVDDVYRPLKMAPGVFSTLRTSDDNWNGQPYGGYGLWWTPDDLAKISTFLNVDHGVINGEQVLHPDLLDAALQRNPSDRGVTRNGYGRYNNAFWADEIASEQDPECSFWVSHMYGISGIVVTLMPNGTAYYYASDNQEFTSITAIHESEKLIPMCGE